MFDLGFLTFKRASDYEFNREDLLTQFEKSEKIATEFEFVLPPKEVTTPTECGHMYRNDDREQVCELMNGTPPCLETHTCPMSDKRHFTNLLQTIFEPSRSQIEAGKKGFGEVKNEGSVPSGLELTTVGRRIIYRDLLRQNQFTIDSLLNLGCTVNWRCGLHFHYLLGYYLAGGNTFQEVQCQIPIEVLANVWQLHLIFADVLYWLTAAGTSKQYATRYMKFRLTPFYRERKLGGDKFGLFTQGNIANHPMKDIISKMSKMAYQPKYVFVNMLPAKLTKNNMVAIFHVEFRYPDAALSYNFITMMQVLLAAIIKKAITLSEFGILVPGNNEEAVAKYYEGIAQNLWAFCGEDLAQGTDIDNRDIEGLKRRSKNNLSKEQLSEIRARAKFFLAYLKEEICAYSPTVYKQLQLLADSPLYLLREKKMDWPDIDKHLTINEVDEEISELIDGLYALSALHIVKGQPNLRVWSREVSKIVDVTTEKILGAVRMSELHWDKELGTCVRRY